MGRRGVLTVKTLARGLGVSLPTCYRLVNILVEEGYLQRASTRGGYGLGPAVAALRAGELGGDLLEAKLEPVIGELAQRSGRHAYLGCSRAGR